MIVRLNLPPEKEATFKAQARGLSLEQWILDVHRCSDSSRVLWNWDVLHGLYRRLPLFAGQ